jgi:hypothetical protein
LGYNVAIIEQSINRRGLDWDFQKIICAPTFSYTAFVCNMCLAAMISKQQLFVKSTRPAGSGLGVRGQQGSGFIYFEAERGESQRLRGDSVRG